MKKLMSKESKRFRNRWTQKPNIESPKYFQSYKNDCTSSKNHRSSEIAFVF